MSLLPRTTLHPPPMETGEGATRRPPTGHREETEVMEDGCQTPGPGDLLIEGEEGEYFLELLMRRASPGKPKADLLAGSKEGPKGKTAPAKGKDKKKNRKKALKGNKVAEKSGAQREEESTESLTSKQGKQAAPDLLSKQGKQAAPDLLSNPEAKGRGLIDDNRTEEESAPRSKTTSRGECSGQKMLDS